MLTGRRGLFNCDETSIHIIDSIFNQHAKWLKLTAGLPWRHFIASLNHLLASHDRLPRTGKRGRVLKEKLQAKLIEHKLYIDQNGQDLAEIRNWKWSNIQ